MQHPMAYRADFVHGFDHAEILIRQRVEHHMAGLHMVFNGSRFPIHHFLAADLAFVMAQRAHTDALHQALGQSGFILHVNKLIFQGGRARVHDQNFHVQKPFFLLFSCVRDPILFIIQDISRFCKAAHREITKKKRKKPLTDGRRCGNMMYGLKEPVPKTAGALQCA